MNSELMKELKDKIFNTLDFSRGVFSISQEFCEKNGIDFSGEIHGFIRDCIKEYHNMKNNFN